MKIGQASSEYLVIIAVVLLVALAGVVFVTYYSGTPGDAAMTQSQIYWQSAARPIKVSDAQSVYDSGASKGGYSLSAENVDYGSLTLTGVKIDGISREFKAENSSINSSVNMGSGEKRLISVYTTNSDVPCVEGKQVELDVVFVYMDQYGSQTTQKGKSKLIMRCSTPASSVGSGPSCAASGESCASLSCCGGLSCQDGTCQAASICGGTTLGACAEGSVCCRTSTCPFTYSCISGVRCPWCGVCSYCCSDGAICNEMDECCTEGFTCQDGTCQSSCSPEGGACEPTNINAPPCCSGTHCSGAVGFCIPDCASGGEECLQNSDCCEGYGCSSKQSVCACAALEEMCEPTNLDALPCCSGTHCSGAIGFCVSD